MTRLPRGVPAFVALMGIAAFAAGPADAKVKRYHATPKRHVAHAPRSPYDFPMYVDRGSDRNPGGDNLYYSDTKDPAFFNGPDLVGPAYFQRWWSTTY